MGRCKISKAVYFSRCEKYTALLIYFLPDATPTTSVLVLRYGIEFERTYVNWCESVIKELEQT